MDRRGNEIIRNKNIMVDLLKVLTSFICNLPPIGKWSIDGLFRRTE